MNKVIILFLLFTNGAFAKSINGFEIKAPLIPLEEIKRGGPPRDGIPSIDHPLFISADKAKKIFPKTDRALIVKRNNEIKVYPISILNWHEIVNDEILGEPIVITFCPLCGTGMVFKRNFKGKKRSFGVSGLLYQSDVLLYDRETSSLWSQLLMKSISGEEKGHALSLYPSSHVELHPFLLKNPKAKVLSMDTGFKGLRDYYRSPYGKYSTNDRIYFPIKFPDSTFHKKNWTLGIFYRGKVVLVAQSSLTPNKQKLILNIANKKISISYDKNKRTFHCPKISNLKCITGYWFALRTFYPKAKIHK